MTPSSPQPDDVDSFFRDFQAEADRLGLDLTDLPGLATSGGSDGLNALLEHMRALSPGCTWRDVFPDLPEDWNDPARQRAPQPYRPQGPLDFQQPPAGALVHVSCAPGSLDQLCAAAVAEGFRIHAAWVYASVSSLESRDDDEDLCWITFEYDGHNETVITFWRWLQERPELGSLHGIFRHGDEQYPDAE